MMEDTTARSNRGHVSPSVPPSQLNDIDSVSPQLHDSDSQTESTPSAQASQEAVPYRLDCSEHSDGHAAGCPTANNSDDDECGDFGGFQSAAESPDPSLSSRSESKPDRALQEHSVNLPLSALANPQPSTQPRQSLHIIANADLDDLEGISGGLNEVLASPDTAAHCTPIAAACTPGLPPQSPQIAAVSNASSSMDKFLGALAATVPSSRTIRAQRKWKATLKQVNESPTLHTPEPASLMRELAKERSTGAIHVSNSYSRSQAGSGSRRALLDLLGLPEMPHTTRSVHTGTASTTTAGRTAGAMRGQHGTVNRSGGDTGWRENGESVGTPEPLNAASREIDLCSSHSHDPFAAGDCCSPSHSGALRAPEQGVMADFAPADTRTAHMHSSVLVVDDFVPQGQAEVTSSGRQAAKGKATSRGEVPLREAPLPTSTSSTACGSTFAAPSARDARLGGRRPASARNRTAFNALVDKLPDLSGLLSAKISCPYVLSPRQKPV